MKLQDIMIREVVQVAPGDSIRQAAGRMREKSVGCLVAMVDGSLKGIITDRDLLVCFEKPHDPDECKVSTHMSRPVIVERPEEEVVTAVEVMRRNRIKRLPVVKDGNLVGIVSFSDIAAALHGEAEKFWPLWRAITGLVRAQGFQGRGPKLNAHAEGKDADSGNVYVRRQRSA